MAVRGTTPDFELTVAGYDLTEQTVFVTIEQGGTQITLTGDDLDIGYADETSTILFSLSQADTLKLKKGHADIQVRFIDSDGHAEATETKQIRIDDVLLEKVIEYAEDST
jgi:hypothetical protein